MRALDTRLLKRTVLCFLGRHRACTGYAYGKGGFDKAPCTCTCHARKEGER